MFVNIESLGLGARAAWGQKDGAANRPAYYVKEKQTSLLIDKILFYYYLYLSIFVLGVWLCFVYTNKEGTKSGLLESSDTSPTKKNCTHWLQHDLLLSWWKR